MAPREAAVMVVLLTAPVFAALALAYRATQGKQRADSILRWATVTIYVGAALWAATTFDKSEVWSSFALVVLFCGFGAGRLSRSFRRQLGPRRALVVLRNAYAGQTVGAWLCAVQAAIYGKAIGVFLGVISLSIGALWLWVTAQLSNAIAAQAASHGGADSN